MSSTLRLILGDQLNAMHSWFSKVDNDVTYVMLEMDQELTYTTHHVQKVVAFFLAMRHFADALRSAGHRVIYRTLDDPENTRGLSSTIEDLVGRHGFGRFEYQLPDEWRLDEELEGLAERLPVPVGHADTEHFMTARDELAGFFGQKSLLMETFYRRMRKKHGVLMDGAKPVGGRWNFDHDNRKKMPKGLEIPEPRVFPRDVSDLVALLEERGVETIGRIDPERFHWPVTRAESLELFDFFLEHCLPSFGAYQDAMTPDGWSLFHSRISFALNAKLLSPDEVIRRVEAEWRARPDDLPLAAVEGFIRQILGWREFMRGVYWKTMPEYAERNFFGHDRPLPSWYWTGKTRMRCLSHAIDQSLDHAYAHHIQRLMITGNFALLAGIHPDAVDQWYLGIYIDAIEWVEITNTRGMSQFADGGVVATKPYVSSANYIHKMSHYCGGCAYDHRAKTGDGACPFNSLYWSFLDRHRNTLGSNHRMGMIYRVWDKMDEQSRRSILKQASEYLGRLDEL